MKRLLPDHVELAILGTSAILCAAFVADMNTQDLGLSLFSIPLFIAAAVMGMRRSGQFDHIQETMSQEPEAEERSA